MVSVRDHKQENQRPDKRTDKIKRVCVQELTMSQRQDVQRRQAAGRNIEAATKCFVWSSPHVMETSSMVHTKIHVDDVVMAATLAPKEVAAATEPTKVSANDTEAAMAT